MGHMGWWRPFGLEAELEKADDPVDGLSFFDKRDDAHLATTCGQTHNADCRSPNSAPLPP